MIKINKLYELADELGIRILFEGYQVLIVDGESNINSFRIEDVDNPRENLSSFPPNLEFRVVCDNPEYVKLKEQEYEAWIKRRNEERLAEEEKKKQEALEGERIRREKLEQRERAQYEELKKKYG